MGRSAGAHARHLRGCDTVKDGAAYIRDQQLTKEDLLAVADKLGLTRVSHLTKPKLQARVLQQAIGARRKFAGLRHW